MLRMLRSESTTRNARLVRFNLTTRKSHLNHCWTWNLSTSTKPSKWTKLWLMIKEKRRSTTVALVLSHLRWTQKWPWNQPTISFPKSSWRKEQTFIEWKDSLQSKEHHRNSFSIRSVCFSAVFHFLIGRKMRRENVCSSSSVSSSRMLGSKRYSTVLP